MADPLGERTDAQQAEAERRWAIKSILIDYMLHCEYRHEHRPDPAIWPSQHDIAETAITRLDLLYAALVAPNEITAECSEHPWITEPPGGADYAP